MPAPLRGGRIDPGRRGVLLVATLAVLAAVVAVALVLHGRARPVAAAVTAPEVVATGADPLTAAARIEVDVEGKVRRPGLVSLASGARVDDAIRAAGGVYPGTDTSSLDLAQRATDGEQIRVGAGVPSSVAGTSPAPTAVGSGGGSAAGGPVDLNTATAAQLDALPRIGPATAQKILDWRQAHGGFSSVDQLQQIPGIGPSTYQQLAPLVTV